MSENLISLGDILQKKRQEIGLTIDQVSQFLHVKPATILEIESNQIESLRSQKIYTLGLIRSYAKFLKIDVRTISEQINSLQLASNTENKSHILINIGEEDKLSPSKDDFLKFSLISILLFVIVLSVYGLNVSENSISNEEIISKLEEIDGNQN